MKNNKKVLSVALAGALAFGSMGAAFAAVPEDVKGTDYETAVERLAALDILKGYEDGTFRPDRTITRAEFATVVVRALGLESSAKASMGTTSFNDVASNHWASGYINIASGLKVVNGRGDGVFDPEAPVKYEEAVTMLVRALGYEPAAKAKGGYPNGYLVVAGQEDITDDVNGVIGLASERGIVAQLVDNSLEVPMMVQVGYGDEAKFVKSGTDGTDKETLLVDKLDVEYTEDVLTFTDSQKDDNKVSIGSKELEVMEGFNFEGLKDVNVKAYFNDDDILVSYEAQDDVYVDAVEINVDGDDVEVKLVGMDKTYNVADDTRMDLSGLTDGEEFEYAKVIIEDGKVVALDTIASFDGYILVEDVDGDVISGHEEELNLDDYTVMKDGVEISASDIKEGDVVFYNDSKDFAEVYTKTITGKVEDVLTDQFTIDGVEYNYEGAFYLDSDSEKSTTDLEDKVSDMEDKETTIYVNRQGEVVLVDVDEDAEETGTVVGLLDGKIKSYSNRGETYYGVDVINKDGKEVSYDAEFDEDLIAGDEDLDAISGLVELKIDVDGNLEEIVVLDSKDVANVDVDDNYAGGFKLDDSALVFNTEKYTDDAEDIKISAWGDVDFDEAIAATVYAEDGVVKYMVVQDADNDAEDVTTEKALVTEVKKVSGKDELRIKAYVGGEEKVFYTDTNEKLTIEDIDNDSATGLDMDDAKALVGKIVELDIDDETGKVVNESAIAVIDGTTLADGTVKVSKKEIVSGETTYRLISDAKVFEVDGTDVEVMSVSDIDFTDYTVTVIEDEAGTAFVKYVILTPASK
ncbi:S-layer homology domain-containing protein [Tepidibacter aestuarii]|uniref:S-layer homology domain-containing protein n=1 Tax=Tepidibacter aestuarii TaxID=2925782 RepID=UPI0020BF618E|nr:S-layer homology domain-containing protein [Tepidibacter aestuarii]CAH2215096.1 putative S-layer homology domain-containing protein [Tepidibacter aestuarii]CAH2215097.1 putative S-layer homology domain-containing protein [Tepidibacter aestuarii]